MGFWRQNDRHAGVYLGDQLVRLAGDDHASSYPLFGVRVLPAIPEARENKRGTIFHFERIRNFSLGRFLPFVKAVGRNQASALLKRPAKGWSYIDPFCSGVDKTRITILLWWFFGTGRT